MLRPSFLLLASAQGRPALDEAHPLVSAAGLLDTSATHPGLACRWGSYRKPTPWSPLPRRALVAGGDRSAPTEPAGETSQANRRFAVKFTNLPLSHRPKRAPSFGVSDGGGTRERGAHPLVSPAGRVPARGRKIPLGFARRDFGAGLPQFCEAHPVSAAAAAREFETETEFGRSNP